MSDAFIFANQSKPDESAADKPPFRILIVDDDDEIHVITRMALGDFQLDGRSLEFVSAYSGTEARKILTEYNDFALILLDVVMENDHAGLDLARWIRDSLNNRLIRIVLRTGQPGQAPEEDIIARYEIDDYKEKTELTYRKLVTLMYSSLRAYRELCRIERNRRSLEQIIRASAQLFSASSLRELSEGILDQVITLVTHAETAAYCNLDGLTAQRDGQGQFEVLAAIGQYRSEVGQTLAQHINRDVIQHLIERQQRVTFCVEQGNYYGLYATRSGQYYLLFIKHVVRDDGHDNSEGQLAEHDQYLLELFMNNTAIAFEHARLNPAT